MTRRRRCAWRCKSTFATQSAGVYENWLTRSRCKTTGKNSNSSKWTRNMASLVGKDIEGTTMRRLIPDEHYHNREQFPAAELAKYYGKEVAWSLDGSRIVASGDDPPQVCAAVKDAG